MFLSMIASMTGHTVGKTGPISASCWLLPPTILCRWECISELSCVALMAVLEGVSYHALCLRMLPAIRGLLAALAVSKPSNQRERSHIPEAHKPTSALASKLRIEFL
jgi:hypothetical protein